MPDSARLTFPAAFVAVTSAALTACAALASGSPDVTDDGLQRVPTALLDELYVAPNVSLANYKRVMLDPVEVEFEKDWRKQHRDMSDRDFDQLRARLAAMLHETLVAELARGGYTVAEAPAPDVMRLRPRIVDADFAAPEANSFRRALAYSDGQMTLRIEGFDGPSGALVARAKDYEEDPETRILQRADRTTALVNAQRIFDAWARELRSALDVAKVSAGARQPRQ